MKIIIGLGNPTIEYSYNRHNVGFVAIDALSWRYRVVLGANVGHSICGGAIINGEEVILVKPNTYMNSSGLAVKEIMHYADATPEDIIVIHDDIDLKLGDIRHKRGGSAGGHNGLKSIDSEIGNKYYRYRIGVGRPQDNTTVLDYVLGNFTKEEFEKIPTIIYETNNKLIENFLEKNEKLT